MFLRIGREFFVKLPILTLFLFLSLSKTEMRLFFNKEGTMQNKVKQIMGDKGVYIVVFILAVGVGIGLFYITSQHNLDLDSKTKKYPVKLEVIQPLEIYQPSYEYKKGVGLICVFDQTGSLYEDLGGGVDKERIFKRVRNKCVDYVEETLQEGYCQIAFRGIPLGTLTGYGAVPVAEAYFACSEPPPAPKRPQKPEEVEIPYAEELGLNSKVFGPSCEIPWIESSFDKLDKITEAAGKCKKLWQPYFDKVKEYNSTLPDYKQKMQEWEKEQQARSKEFIDQVKKQLDEVGQEIATISFDTRNLDMRSQRFPCRLSGRQRMIGFEQCTDFNVLLPLLVANVNEFRKRYKIETFHIVLISDFVPEEVVSSEDMTSLSERGLEGVTVTLVHYRVPRKSNLAEVREKFQKLGAKVDFRAF